MATRVPGKHEAEFVIEEIGENTGENFKGRFIVKTRLSHRDHLLQDSVRRSLLGTTPGDPAGRAASSAEIFSQLSVRIVESPSWWKDADNGTELFDDAPVTAVYNAAIKAEKDAVAALTAKGEQAQKDLGKLGEDVTA